MGIGNRDLHWASAFWNGVTFCMMHWDGLGMGVQRRTEYTPASKMLKLEWWLG